MKYGLLFAAFHDVVNAPAGRLADAGGRHLICCLLSIAEVGPALESAGYLFVLNLHYKLEGQRQLIDIEGSLTAEHLDAGAEGIVLAGDSLALGADRAHADGYDCADVILLCGLLIPHNLACKYPADKYDLAARTKRLLAEGMCGNVELRRQHFSISLAGTCA